MSDSEHRGVAFPTGADGRRSTAAFGRAVVAAALSGVDPVGARAAAQETAWRAKYLGHFRRLVEAGLGSAPDWNAIAADGLDAVHRSMTTVSAGSEQPLSALLTAPAERKLTTAVVKGEAPAQEFALPYRGQLLRGDEIRRRVAEWVSGGIAEPTLAEAVDDVLAHPEWLRLEGRTLVAIGAGSEMGPVSALLRWGARVAAVDLPRPASWQRLLQNAREGAGELLVPVPDGPASTPGDADPERAGADVLTDAPAIADWLAGLAGPLTVGNYAYADGGKHVLVSAAVDALTQRVSQQHGDVSLAFLATPTDVFAVPADAVEHSARAYAGRSRSGKALGRPLRTVSRGRLLRRAYLPGADPGICDSLIPQQGPNYALAKRIQRWRATVAREAGTAVSFHVAPSSRTQSVVKNRALAAAFAGAPRFGVEIFEPATSNALMAALLVRDLQAAPAPQDHPWRDEAYAAAHGGLWRMPYAPRSALGLAALLGYAAR